MAAVAAENVVSEGASTLAALAYVAARESLTYLDAAFNDPLDPDGRWSLEQPDLGRSVLVPGAPAGLAALGRVPLADLLAPAIVLAEGGGASRQPG